MSLNGHKILIAEDNATNRFVVETSLKGLGYTSFIACNGKEAVEIYRQHAHEINLILMDIVMPEMDGYEATAAIRNIQQETGATAPIIALTSQSLSSDRQKCLDSGMSDYLAKPFTESDFAEIVKKHLN